MSDGKAALRSPLGRVRGLGSAKQGVHHWWVQRLSALALVPLALWLVASVVGLAGAEHAAVVAWIANPVVAVLLSLTVIAAFYHAQLGLQVVFEDYIHGRALRLFAEIATRFAAFALGAGTLFAILKIAFSA